MGRDEHTPGGNSSRSLPQTPKKQKIKPADMKEEIARELAELRKTPSTDTSSSRKSARWP